MQEMLFPALRLILFEREEQNTGFGMREQPR
nr:MAG TPA: hypothetical protein [Caudoviricetes sp.]